MSLGEIGAALWRRWYIVGLVVLLTVGGGLYVLHRPVSYQATAVLRLKPPRSPRFQNQYVNFTPSLATTDNAVAVVLSSQTGVAQIRAAGVTDSYSIAPKNTGTVQTPVYDQPWLQISASAADPATADHEVDLLRGVFDAELRALQQQWGVIPSQFITSNVLVPTDAQPVRIIKSRALLGVAFLGVLAGVLLPLWCDEILRHRRSRRAGFPDRPMTADA